MGAESSRLSHKYVRFSFSAPNGLPLEERKIDHTEKWEVRHKMNVSEDDILSDNMLIDE
jgi:hypothetical protein